jgi:hypothetical protein
VLASAGFGAIADADAFSTASASIGALLCQLANGRDDRPGFGFSPVAC